MAEIIGRRERFQNFFQGFLKPVLQILGLLVEWPIGNDGMMPTPATSLPCNGGLACHLLSFAVHCCLFGPMTVPYPETKPHVQGHHS